MPTTPTPPLIDYNNVGDAAATAAFHQLMQTAQNTTVQAFASSIQLDSDGDSIDYQESNANTAPPTTNAAMAALAQPPRVRRPLPPLPTPVFYGPEKRPLPGFQVPAQNVQSKGVQGVYQQEVSDDRHRMGDVLQMVYLNLYLWQNPGKSMDAEFFEWLDGFSYFDMVTVLTLARSRQNPNLPMDQVKAYANKNVKPFCKGVAYLTEASRKSYKVKVNNGLLMWQGKPLDTAKMETVFSGLGWGIWIMSPPMGKKNEHKFYTASHKFGEFHHSSFLAGGDIVAGGEWKVTNGVIDFINSKTGHYKTSLEAMALALETLHKRQVKLVSTQVIVYDNNQPSTRSVASFLRNDQAVRGISQPAGNQQFGARVNPQPKGSFIGTHRTPQT